MSMEKVSIAPGVNIQATQMLNEAGWSYSGFMRFRDGMVEKIRGWVRFISDELVGTCRFILAWQSLSSVPYLALGTHKRLNVFAYGSLYDITPLRASGSVAVAFDAATGDATITITDTAHGASDGDGIYIVNRISVGGLIIYGYYEVAVVDADNLSIEAADLATANVTNGGATAVFDTTNTSPIVEVTLADHGLVADEVYTVDISTVVGGLTLFGDYVVTSVVDDDVFTITASANASSTATASENGGNVKINYLIAAGLEDAAPIQGYGIGGYGEGLYGFGDDSSDNAPMRHWSGLAWGEDLIASPTNGAVYLWDSSAGVHNNVATVISQAPSMNTQILLAMPQRQIVALGAEDSGAQDMLLIKWCDVGDYTDWRDLADPYDPNSQAGFFRLPRGGKIVGGMVGPSQIFIWTDISLWLMQYIQPPLLYGFNEIGIGCGLIGPKAMGVMGSAMFWMSNQGFFAYANGSVQRLPCPLWDIIFDNMDQEQAAKVCCKQNSQYGEIAWSIPSTSGENDMEVKFIPRDGIWDYTIDTAANQVGRTAWLDWSIWGAPIGVRADGTVCQHEIGFDDLESPLVAFIESGWFKIANGQFFVSIERLIPDFVLSDGDTVYVTVRMKDYPNDDTSVREYGPFAVTSETKYVIVRGRGRLASVKISSVDSGVFWRLGQILYKGLAAGRR